MDSEHCGVFFDTIYFEISMGSVRYFNRNHVLEKQ